MEARGEKPPTVKQIREQIGASKRSQARGRETVANYTNSAYTEKVIQDAL
jgi:hypothetical protein